MKDKDDPLENKTTPLDKSDNEAPLDKSDNEGILEGEIDKDEKPVVTEEE